MDRSTVRDYAHLAVDSVRTWSGAGLELHRLRGRLRALGQERTQLLHDLGAAVYAGDDAERERLLESLRAVDRDLEETRVETQRVVEGFELHVRQESLSVRPTEIVSRSARRNIDGAAGTRRAARGACPRSRP